MYKGELVIQAGRREKWKENQEGRQLGNRETQERECERQEERGRAEWRDWLIDNRFRTKNGSMWQTRVPVQVFVVAVNNGPHKEEEDRYIIGSCVARSGEQCFPWPSTPSTKYVQNNDIT